MDPRQVLPALFTLWLLLHRALADSKAEKSILEALADADRYASGFSDSSYVANAWERVADGWVRGGYTLVAGDTRTDVRYAVSPEGEMRVMARRPPKRVAATTTTTRTASAATGPRVLNMLQRLHRHFDAAAEHVEDDDAFDDSLDDDDPFFLDDLDDFSTPREWTRLIGRR